MSSQPHSADYFGDTRDHWWNRDFLQLMSQRWELHAVKRVLDVGCGIGHWSRCLTPFLSADCALTGVDREPQSLEEARKRSTSIHHLTTTFLEADAARLPFPDASFDMVTCQTVLIHVNDPVAVLREMIRVLTPGGLIALAEPNNAASNLSPIDPEKPIRETLDLLEFQMICERGKRILGEGYNSAGPLIPGWLSDLGVRQIASYLSDKTTMLLPPHTSEHARATIQEMDDRDRREFWFWNREDTHRYFLAGGGSTDAFATSWGKALAHERSLLDSVPRMHRSITHVPVLLLVSGRKAPSG